ncbi:MAG TPA: FecR domain-containing protein, partial [Sphingobacteriaceae bacterium]
MNTTDFKNLVTRYLAGKTTVEEEKQLLKYYDHLQERNIHWDIEKMGNEDEVKKRLYDNALNEISRQENLNKGPIVRSIFSYWKVAAAIVTIASAGLFFYLKTPGLPVAKVEDKTKPVQNDVPPGGNKAILTLADGSQIILDNAQDGTLTTQGNIAVSKSKDGQLVYKVGNSHPSTGTTEPVFNTIITPVGGQYQVILSDNTKVWLNASSSIRFPATFTGNYRSVEIEGEAYFEVAADKKRPFKVLSDGQVIEVLGTHFNVNAYRDENKVKTTLLEGSVKISSGAVSNIIKPGQQAQLVRGKESFQVINIDPEEAVAWKNGLFMFDDED